ncbi:zinc transporter 2-like protein [Leptotrombidium deliense]|uniref:Zinc transporter 2-like protein n=1 Tax=Leptotrombidium deliense TaxID=299467 RepID=A0A443SWD0_9ACAR|nr:zinc transporter 2-like protein [Leptotrombidium deliense]
MAPKSEASYGAQSSGDSKWASHCHSLELEDFSHQKSASTRLQATAFFCALFMIAEMVGGYIANSLAIMSDAAHLFTDLSGFFLSIFAVWISKKQPTRRFSYGYARMEILGAMASTLIIWMLTAVLVYVAIERVRTMNFEINSFYMIIVSLLGLIVNVLMAVILNGCQCMCKNKDNNEHELFAESQNHNHHHNSHGHSHMNMNVRAAFIHIIGDFLQSLGALIAAIIIHYKPEYKIADPICTFIFSVIVICTTINILKDTFYILMEAFPKSVDYIAVKRSLEEIDGVKMAHSLHIWVLTPEKMVLSVHLAIEANVNSDVVLSNAEHLIQKTFGIQQTTIQIERYDASIMTNCSACQLPQ